EVAHPELGRSFTYPLAKWVTRWPERVDWRRGPRAPFIGEHTEEVLGDLTPRPPSLGGKGVPWANASDEPEARYANSASEGGAPFPPREGGRGVRSVPKGDTRLSRRGKPFALHGVRILDFTWWLASGGGPRFLSALGAEDLKVEWIGNMDHRV